MSAIEVTISGVLYDKLSRTTRPCVLIGEASLTGLGVGGGPIIPGGGGEGPPHIWGPPDMPPGFWGGGMGPGVKPQPHPEHPIVLPPETPPDFQPPPPGSPPVLIPGAGPSHPMVAPDFIVVDYPGMGKVLVPKPLPSDPTRRPPVAQR